MDRRNYRCRMRFVQRHRAKIIIVGIEEDDLIRQLNYPQKEIPEKIGYGVLETLVVGVRIYLPRQGEFAKLLDLLRSLGLQNRIGVIACHLIEIALPARQPRPVRYRARPRQRRAKAKSGMCPQTGESR